MYVQLLWRLCDHARPSKSGSGESSCRASLQHLCARLTLAVHWEPPLELLWKISIHHSKFYGKKDERYDKIAVEESVLKNPHVAGTVLRLPMLYGPGDPVHRFFPLLKRFADGRASVILSEDIAAWRGPRGYIENVVRAIALAAIPDRAAGRVYNVCDEPDFSELEWQKRIAAQAKWSGNFVVLPVDQTPRHLLQPGNAAQHIVVTAEKIRMELHYEEPVSTDEAIRRTIAWEHKNPPAMINTQQFDYPAEYAALRTCA